MIQKKVLIRTLSGVLVGGMLLTFGGFALAANDKNADPNGLAGKFAPFGKFMKQNRAMHKVGFKGLGQETLNLLVKEGTLTQGKADEIKAFLDKKTEEMKEERKAQFEQNGVGKFKRIDLFTELVANKILTQEQVDAVKAKLQITMKSNGQKMFGDFKGLEGKNNFRGLNQASFDLLVKDGIISQAEADGIKAFLDKKVEERKAQMEEFQKLTPEERKAQFEQKGPALTQRTDLFSELVANKILTQEKADAIKAKLQEQGNSLGKMMFKQKGHMGTDAKI